MAGLKSLKFLVNIIEASPGGQGSGCPRNDLDKSRLHYFYWTVARIDIVLFFVFLWIASRNGRKGNGRVADWGGMQVKKEDDNTQVKISFIYIAHL